MVHGNVEEALDLFGVEIDGYDPVRAAKLYDIGDQTGRDRLPWLDLLVLPGVAVIRDHHRDPPGRGPAERVEHDEQLQQIVVGGATGRLDDEDLVASGALIDHDADLAVRELARGQAAELDPEVLRDLLGKLRVGVAAEQLHAAQVL